MRSLRQHFYVLAFCLAATFATACGGSASLSPVGPSPAGGAGATISGSVNTGLSVAPLGTNTFGTRDARAVTITVVGTSVATTADSQGQFTLTNVPPGTVVLNFSGPDSNATITISGIGPNDQVQISVTLTGATARVESERHSSPDNNKREFQGRITSVNAAARSFEMSGMTVKAPATAVIRHGNKTVQFADLKVGDHVQVRGAKDGTTLTATEIKVESGGGDDGEDDDQIPQIPAAELAGTVSLQAGTCPAVTFTTQSTRVSTAAATTYLRGTCAGIQNGARVQVVGTKQADGSVLATRISIEDAPATPTMSELEGIVSLKAGTCPAITFTVQNTKVSAATATSYEHGACAAVKNGGRVQVTGARQTDGSVAATRISLKD